MPGQAQSSRMYLIHKRQQFDMILIGISNIPQNNPLVITANSDGV
jgi:hypothetical protein